MEDYGGTTTEFSAELAQIGPEVVVGSEAEHRVVLCSVSA